MLLRVVRAPLLAVRKVARLFTGGGVAPPPPPRAADPWELRHARHALAGDPAWGGGKDCSTGGGTREQDQGQDQDQGHDHGHGHGEVAEA